MKERRMKLVIWNKRLKIDDMSRNREGSNKWKSSLPPSPIMIVTMGTFSPAMTVRFVAIACSCNDCADVQ